MAVLAFCGFVFYSNRRFVGKSIQKIPFIVISLISTYFQTRTIIWYDKVPYLYSFAFILISAIMLKTTIVNSVMFAVFLLAIIWPTLIEAGLSSSMLLSAAVVTMMFIIYLREKHVSDINLFISNQSNLESQKRIIEIQMEFTNQIRAFLPAEISRRLSYCVQDRQMNVLQATDEVLQPKNALITCLFSDVRGFTKSSNDLNGFVSKSLFPNLKAMSNAIERFQGIPRKIGDLLFAYYDSNDFKKNIVSVVKSAVEISNLNAELNAGLPDGLRITRYILISAGEAVVGNLGGYDSNIEITAIGRPVNLLSRIDEITKLVALQNILIDGDIILTPDVAKFLKKIYPAINLTMVSLDALNIKVRDFDELLELYLLPVTKSNYKLVFDDEKAEKMLIKTLEAA